MEMLIERALVLGLGALTLGVVSGAVFAERVSMGGFETLRVLLSYMLWLMVAGILLGRRLIGYHGRRVAWASVFVAAVAVGIVVLYMISTAAPGEHA